MYGPASGRSSVRNGPRRTGGDHQLLIVGTQACLAGRQRRPGGKVETLRLECGVVAMGSADSVAVHGEHRTRMEEAVDAALEEVHRLDEMLSNYKPESELSEINRAAAERPVAVTPELFD